MPFRLPLSSFPYHYDLSITPAIPAYTTFSGTVNVTLEMVQDTSCIVLNNWGLQFEQIVLNVGGKMLTPVSSVPSAYYQTHVMDFGTILPLNLPLNLYIAFSGTIQTNATGFFKSAGDYPTEDLALPEEEIATAARNWRSKGQRRNTKQYSAVKSSRAQFNTTLVMLATQFESSYARMAFPSYDEPSFKATFAASFLVPSNRNLTVLFNTPQVSVTPAPGNMQLVSFATTPERMSCYLVAYAIGQFDYVEAVSNNITFRVYTPPGKGSYGEYSLNVTIATINYFGNLWAFKFPFPKVDSIAVPAIVQDAMENWGLLTYDPNFLLIAPTTPFNQRQLVTEVVTHELSHQWFGDIITMPWFSQMYLNEGFARYLQYVMTNELFPEWNVWSNGPDYISFLQFAYSMIEEDALGLLPGCVVPDAMYDGNPWVSTYLPTDWENLFYGKGAAVNRMFATWLGPEWIKALQVQLLTHQYTNPTVTDLMGSLDAVNPTAGPSMLPWLMQSNFPVVTLSYNPTTRLLNVSQMACSMWAEGNEWFIPLEIQVDNKLYNIVLNETSATFDLGLTSPPSLIFGNPNYTAYAVMNYDDSNWSQLLSPDFVQTLNESMQLQFAQSLYILALMSHRTLNDTLIPFAKALNALNSNSSVVWPYVIGKLRELMAPVWANQSASRDSLFMQICDGISSIGQRIGLKAPSPLPGWTPSLQGQVLAAEAFFICMPAYRPLSSVYLQAHGNLSSPLLPPFIWPAVLLIEVQRDGGTSLWSELTHYAAASPEAQAILDAVARGSFKPTMCSKITEYALTYRVTSQPAAFLQLMQTMMQNPWCSDIAWNQVQVHAPTYLAELGGVNIGQNVLDTFTDVFQTTEQMAQALAFTKTYDAYFEEWQIAATLRTIILNANFVNAQLSNA